VARKTDKRKISSPFRGAEGGGKRRLRHMGPEAPGNREKSGIK